MKTKIYGWSDDNLEIEGPIEDEASCYYATNLLIKASDGTIARVTYNGDWKISVTTKGGKFLKVVETVGEGMRHTDPDATGCTSYSDVLVLDEGIDWVQVGRKKFRP